MTSYRKIYENYYGVKIPKDHHIHHKDMNHENDDPLNLECLHKDVHAQKHGFLNNFIMAQSTALERSHITRRKPENRARMSALKMGVGIGNKYALGSKGPLGFKHSPESNAANAERAKSQWAAMTQEEKNAMGRAVSASLMGNTRTLGKTWKHNDTVKSHYLSSWTPERRAAHSLRMKGKTWKWKKNTL
jgi:hypothetical protein